MYIIFNSELTANDGITKTRDTTLHKMLLQLFIFFVLSNQIDMLLYVQI